MEISFSKDKTRKEFRFDRPFYTLLLSNLIVIVLALVQKWEIGVLMWIYWGQSVSIGFFNFIKMRNLQNFSTDGVRMNHRPVEATPRTRRSMSFFFAFHYGFFHFGYFLFLTGFSKANPLKSPEVLFCMIIFFVNHGISFLNHWKEETETPQNIGKVMIFPYARILPMHLTIIFGNMLAKKVFTLVLFLVLKTLADVIMHLAEHAKPMKIERKGDTIVFDASGSEAEKNPQKE